MYTQVTIKIFNIDICSQNQSSLNTPMHDGHIFLIDYTLR